MKNFKTVYTVCLSFYFHFIFQAGSDTEVG